MFKTIIALLYIVPALMTAYMAFQYFHAGNLIELLNQSSTILEKHTAGFQNILNDNRPDLDEIRQINARLLRYHQTTETLSFSWNDLYRTLETILPAGIRLTRIRILPKSVIRITIEGSARELEDVTCLLRSLYKLDRFANPRLSRHSKLTGKDESGIAFNMDVDYLPTSVLEVARP